MRAILVGGIYDGHRISVDDDPPDTLTITRWKAGRPPDENHPYIREGYQVKTDYKKGKVLNLGEPVIYYTHHHPAVSMSTSSLAGALGGAAAGFNGELFRH